VPGTSAVRARLARVAFLRGDAEEATRLAKQAEEGARREGAFGATLAWYTAFRGKLALDGGRYDDALALYRRAAKIAPEYHVAIGGLAAATAAGGDIDEAIGLYRRAIRIVPDPVYLGALGDLYARSDRADLARQRYGAVDAIATIAATQRRAYDRQLALFWADHDRRLDDALEIARTSLETRRDIYGYDTLAWVQFRLGELADARSASDRALALGTPDPRLWFHAGMISAALGEDERAARELSTALRLSPRFDALLSEAARTTLAGLTG
jgi:tetratricopeptide (TPR) repeat protein